MLVFVWNDLEDNFDDKKGGRPVAVIEKDNTLRIANRPVKRRWKSPVRQWFRHHSHLFRFGEYNLELMKLQFKDKKRADHRIARDPEPGVDFATDKKRKKARMKFSIADIYAPPGKTRNYRRLTMLSIYYRNFEIMKKFFLIFIHKLLLFKQSIKARP